MRNKQTIYISGNMGSGKTTLAEKLKLMGREVVFEPIINNPFLVKYFDNKERWGFHLQTFFMTYRTKQYLEYSNYASDVIVDRGIFEDFEVYTQYLFIKGYITQSEFELLKDIYRLLSSNIVPPTKIIYLYVKNINVLKKRIISRSYNHDCNIDYEYIEEINNLYDIWINNFSICPVVKINTEEVNLFDKNNIYELCKEFEL